MDSVGSFNQQKNPQAHKFENLDRTHKEIKLKDLLTHNRSKAMRDGYLIRKRKIGENEDQGTYILSKKAKQYIDILLEHGLDGIDKELRRQKYLKDLYGNS